LARASISSVIRLPGRADAARREQHVDPPAGAEIQDYLARVQVRDGERVAAPEAGLDRLGRKLRLLRAAVGDGAESRLLDVDRAAAAIAATTPAVAGANLGGRGGVPGSHLLSNLLAHRSAFHRSPSINRRSSM
jgi:hypothetical protein